MNTISWGQPSWVYLHTVTFNYPDDPEEYDTIHEKPIGSTRQKYKDFFTNVGETLPCKYCRDSYRIFIKENPIRLDSRDEITLWLYEIHNKVNDKLGKKGIPFEEVQQKYESFRADCSAKKANGCTKLLHNTIPKKCVVIYVPKCSSFITNFFTTIVLLVLARIIYKKSNIGKLLN